MRSMPPRPMRQTVHAMIHSSLQHVMPHYARHDPRYAFMQDFVHVMPRSTGHASCCSARFMMQGMAHAMLHDAVQGAHHGHAVVHLVNFQSLKKYL